MSLSDPHNLQHSDGKLHAKEIFQNLLMQTLEKSNRQFKYTKEKIICVL